MAENIFEQASRQKLRFGSHIGQLSAEDLWDLPLPRLDDLAKALRKELRETEDSFIAESKTDAALELRFEIVKRVIEVRLDERAARQARATLAARRQELLAALELKEREGLQSKSAEELRKELDALEG